MARAVVRRSDPERDRPRWALLSAIAVVALTVGVMGPRACGLRFGAEAPEEPAAPAAPVEPSATPQVAVVASADAGAAPAPAASSDSAALATVVVGKSTLIHCNDPPAGEIKPSKCGEHGLDPHVVPVLEQLATCPAIAGISGKLAITADINVKTQAFKLVAGKGSSAYRAGKRDDKAIEPILRCARASLKDVLAREPAKPEHARYVLAYPVTISAAATSAAPAPIASVEKEKAASGVATVQVDTAIVRDAPSTNGQPIGRLSRGTRVSTIGTSGNWFHVRFGDGDAQEGWIFRTNIGR